MDVTNRRVLCQYVYKFDLGVNGMNTRINVLKVTLFISLAYTRMCNKIIVVVILKPRGNTECQFPCCPGRMMG